MQGSTQVRDTWCRNYRGLMPGGTVVFNGAGRHVRYLRRRGLAGWIGEGLIGEDWIGGLDKRGLLVEHKGGHANVTRLT